MKKSTRLLLPVAAGMIAIGVATLAPTSPANAAPRTSSFQATSVNLTEDDDHYTVTIPNSADGSDANVRMNGRTLHIAAGNSDSSARFEQTLTLRDADPNQAPQFEKQGDKLVVTIPKWTVDSRAASPNNARRQSVAIVPSTAPGMDPMAQRMMAQFQQMQQAMDQMMNQTSGGGMDPFANFGPVNVSSMNGGIGGLNIKDDGNEYVVHASTPGISPENMTVAVDNDRVLRITAKNESSGSNQFQSSNFSQSVTLPGPVQSDKMKVEQQDGGVVIKLPKA